MCTQCTRIHIDCPGYCDPLDQYFRDESERVAKKAQKSYKNQKPSVKQTKQYFPKQPDENNGITTDSLEVGTFVAHRECPLSSPYLAFNLPQAIEEVALTHFMASYIPGSRFDYLPAMYAQSGMGLALTSTIHAASMATLARELGQLSILNMARNAYAIALLKTNSSLSEPSTAPSDATLISVLLLSLFEAIVWASPRTPANWKVHTRGALALINLRGARQFDTPTGRKLYMQVANIACVDSLQHRTHLPPELAALDQIAMQYASESPRYQLAHLTGKVSNLLADVFSNMLTADEVVNKLQCMDEELLIFTNACPKDWNFETIVLAKSSSGVYSKMLHYYPNHRIAQLWNSLRMTRLMLNEIIHAYAACLPLPTRANIQGNAIANVQLMSEDICASIPQFTSPTEVIIDQKSHYARECISIKASAASLLWPLSAVRGCCLGSKDVKAYAVDRLKYMAREARISQVEMITQESFKFDALSDGLHMLFLS